MRLLCLVFAVVSNLPAVTHPNFSGNWKLDLEESDFAGQPAPTSRVEIIQHNDPTFTETIKESNDMGTNNLTLHYTTDGKSSKNTIMGSDLTSTAHWDGEDLVVHSASEVIGKEVLIDDRWKLSLDRNNLTLQRHFEGRGLRSDQTLVFHKQPPSQ